MLGGCNCYNISYREDIVTRACASDSHLSTSSLERQIPMDGKSRKKTLSKILSGMELPHNPLNWRSVMALGFRKFFRERPKRRHTSSKCNLRPRENTQWPPISHRAFVKHGDIPN